MVDETLELKVFVSRSKLRKKVLKELKKGEQISTFLVDDLPLDKGEKKKHRSVISRVLIDLSNKGLAKCTNPKNDKFRKYTITNLGLKILKEIN